MARVKERLPAVYKFFLNNKDKFNQFFGLVGDQAHQVFKDRFVDLLYKHIEYPDLRFSQHLYNSGVVPTDASYYKEEADWLIEQNLVKSEDLLTWGTYGANGDERLKTWEAEKPKLNAPLTIVEKVYGGFTGLKNYEVYGKRYEIWNKNKPVATPVLLKDLSTDHIKNILLTQPQITANYRNTFVKILQEREGVEKIEVKNITVENC